MPAWRLSSPEVAWAVIRAPGRSSVSLPAHCGPRLIALTGSCWRELLGSGKDWSFPSLPAHLPSHSSAGISTPHCFASPTGPLKGIPGEICRLNLSTSSPWHPPLVFPYS